MIIPAILSESSSSESISSVNHVIDFDAWRTAGMRIIPVHHRLASPCGKLDFEVVTAAVHLRP